MQRFGDSFAVFRPLFVGKKNAVEFHNFPPYHIISEVARILPSHLAFTAKFFTFSNPK